ncbi:hypothetical protein SGRA_3911 [Saprospira grandis str. Lewin]|uniref:Lipoprotein n=1 Tax=Saprospira grandis (strain Lewin) TaxID=984262 RepID=H6L735_SAPGL|nr:hypothetical protein SGRA_3911 [Saprospira grandis str. Lewin]
MRAVFLLLILTIYSCRHLERKDFFKQKELTLKAQKLLYQYYSLDSMPQCFCEVSFLDSLIKERYIKEDYRPRNVDSLTKDTRCVSSVLDCQLRYSSAGKCQRDTAMTELYFELTLNGQYVGVVRQSGNIVVPITTFCTKNDSFYYLTDGREYHSCKPIDLVQ